MPKTVEAQDLMPTTVTITWEDPDVLNGPIAHFIVQLTSDNNPTIEGQSEYHAMDQSLSIVKIFFINDIKKKLGEFCLQFHSPFSNFYNNGTCFMSITE